MSEQEEISDLYRALMDAEFEVVLSVALAGDGRVALKCGDLPVAFMSPVEAIVFAKHIVYTVVFASTDPLPDDAREQVRSLARELVTEMRTTLDEEAPTFVQRLREHAERADLAPMNLLPSECAWILRAIAETNPREIRVSFAEASDGAAGLPPGYEEWSTEIWRQAKERGLDLVRLGLAWDPAPPEPGAVIAMSQDGAPRRGVFVPMTRLLDAPYEVLRKRVAEVLDAAGPLAKELHP